MKNSEITDFLFREAVEAIDTGDITLLKKLLTLHPKLVNDRLAYPNGQYFKDPYLLWFVADNPIRIDKLPPNIVEVARLLIQYVKQEAPDSMQKQLDYTLELVETGSVLRKRGVQIEMIDLLIDAGARSGGVMGALTNGNVDAAKHLISRGGKLNLTAAVCLGQMDDTNRLAALAGPDEKLTALTAAAFYGKAEMIVYLLGLGADPNGYPGKDSGFHQHATPLHQAVCSGSLEAVKLLVEAGAKLDAEDKVYKGTPLDWAEYMPTEDGHNETAKKNFGLIADYLRGKQQAG
jgi:peptide-methionine (S)-S-oxide reductase